MIPSLTSGCPILALEEATLSVKMTDTLSLNASLDLAHDSKPPQAVKKTDTTYSTGVEYSF